ncbi:MAG: dTDP-4-dehydrorhamnose 3,5-epimerase [Lentisphaerae bacterium]|nr:dTDP-4-dehydrorhamnose 3,5-epimerase [Lentisphaerota bacterium]
MQPTIIPTPIPDLLILELDCVRDERGFFMESWQQRDFAAAGLRAEFVQDNHSRSRQGVLRGMHYQDMRAPLNKLVRCTLGAIFDVAVDLRVGSPTCGSWFGLELSAQNKRQLYVPIGCAHGFLALSEFAEVQYKQTNYYNPPTEGTLLWNDPEVAIKWPIATPLVSPRDARGLSLRQYLAQPAFT